MYKGNEHLLEKFCSEVYKKSYLLLDSVSNMDSLKNYLSRVVETSIHSVIKSNLEHNINDKSFTSINDIVQRPQDYLKTEDLMNIREDYRDVNNYTTFQYLRDMLLDKYETITLIRYADGQVLFADMTSAYDALLPSIANMSKNTNSIFEKYVGKGPISITKFIDPARLSPELMDYTIEFVRDKSGNAGTHNPQTHTIVVNNSKNNAFTRFTILHEFQHAIQNVNRLAGGLSPYFTVSDELLKDFEKNLPQLFAENASVESKKESIRWFLYKTASGEIDANLFGDSVAFMGTLVRGTVGIKTHIVTPWGTEHDIIVKEQGQALELPDYDTGEVLTIIDPKKYSKFYKASQNLLNNQDVDYEYQEQLQETRDKILNVSEVNTYYSQSLGQKAIPESIKKNLVERVQRDNHLHNQMLEVMWQENAPGMSFNEFLDTDIPFVRIQNNENTGDTVASSVLIGEEAFDALMRYTTSGVSVNLYVGTIKAKDVIAYIPGDTLTEALVNYDNVKNANKFTVVKDAGKTYVVNDNNTSITNAETWYDGTIHIGEIFTSDMQQRVISLDNELQERVKKGKARVYDGSVIAFFNTFL